LDNAFVILVLPILQKESNERYPIPRESEVDVLVESLIVPDRSIAFLVESLAGMRFGQPKFVAGDEKRHFVNVRDLNSIRSSASEIF
jgi:hypothetical protein